MTTARHGSWSTHRPGRAVSAAVLLAALAAPGTAATPADVTITHPWMRFLTPQTPAAGYFTLHNSGAQPIVLTGAKSSDCGQLMLHRSVVRNTSASMVMVHSITVPAHGAVTFQPGGYHLMCTSPSTAISPGRQVLVTLTFQQIAPLTATFAVYGPKGD
jgi:periplasmic copper chaperone A